MHNENSSTETPDTRQDNKRPDTRQDNKGRDRDEGSDNFSRQLLSCKTTNATTVLSEFNSSCLVCVSEGAWNSLL